jgi:succinate dehydrogenase / fumarate reductase cytochrome b subunit
MQAITTSNSAGSYVRRTLTSTFGAKVLMGVTGLLFYGWLILHLAGNLAVFAGRETENAYAHFLKATPELLWGQRVGLFIVVVLHIVSGLRLAAINRRARPQPYASPRRWRAASFASRSMAITGLLALAFIVFHLLHFTGGIILPQYYAATPTDPAKVADVYGMVVTSFQVPWVAILYLVGMVLIGLHLSHGVWSATQSLGLNGRRWTPFMKALGLVLGIAVPALFALIPLASLFGVLKP